MPLVLAGWYILQTSSYHLPACLVALLRLLALRAWPITLEHIHHLAVTHIWRVVHKLPIAIHPLVYAEEVDHPGVIQQVPERQAWPPLAEVLRDLKGDGGDEAKRPEARNATTTPFAT